jgi:hypothetical protein
MEAMLVQCGSKPGSGVRASLAVWSVYTVISFAQSTRHTQLFFSAQSFVGAIQAACGQLGQRQRRGETAAPVRVSRPTRRVQSRPAPRCCASGGLPS